MGPVRCDGAGAASGWRWQAAISEHFDLRIVLPDGWRAVRAASRNELRDFAFNWGYARR